MNRVERLTGAATANGAAGTQASDTVASCGIAFMAKASIPGRAKTRLVPPLTFDQAAALNTAFLQDVADNVLLAAELSAPQSRIAGFAAYGPQGREDFFRQILPPAIGLIGAWEANFGDCLFHTTVQILAQSHTAAVVLNADSPTLPTALLVETASLLARPGDRAVLGPSSDGGYYLLGLKAPHRRMFEDIAWSTEHVAAQTLERAREIGLTVEVLPPWYDVDDSEDLRRLDNELSGIDATARRLAYIPHYAAQTAKLMGHLREQRAFTRAAERALQVEEARA